MESITDEIRSIILKNGITGYSLILEISDGRALPIEEYKFDEKVFDVFLNESELLTINLNYTLPKEKFKINYLISCGAEITSIKEILDFLLESGIKSYNKEEISRQVLKEIGTFLKINIVCSDLKLEKHLKRKEKECNDMRSYYISMYGSDINLINHYMYEYENKHFFENIEKEIYDFYLKIVNTEYIDTPGNKTYKFLANERKVPYKNIEEAKIGLSKNVRSDSEKVVFDFFILNKNFIKYCLKSIDKNNAYKECSNKSQEAGIVFLCCLSVLLTNNIKSSEKNIAAETLEAFFEKRPDSRFKSTLYSIKHVVNCVWDICRFFNISDEFSDACVDYILYIIIDNNSNKLDNSKNNSKISNCKLEKLDNPENNSKISNCKLEKLDNPENNSKISN
ncbi:hypothetical protein ACE5NI_18360, partial [Clostridioides difficile]